MVTNTANELPIVIASSVIRSSRLREHGSIYLVDTKKNKWKKVISTDRLIDYSGRGGQRGFRGIAFYDNCTYVAAHDEVRVFDHKFNTVNVINCGPYAGSIHEICIYDGMMYVTSTAFNSVLVFDLPDGKFLYGLHFDYNRKVEKFDDKSGREPEEKDTIHINNVFVDKRGIFVCGTQIKELWLYNNGKLRKYADVTDGTHNCRPYKSGVICNNTSRGKISMFNMSGKEIKARFLRIVDREHMEGTQNDDMVAKQPFARGLTFNEAFIVVGSSPDMLSIYEEKSWRPMRHINFSYDITHAIHGLEIYPYDCEKILRSK